MKNLRSFDIKNFTLLKSSENNVLEILTFKEKVN